MNERHVTLVKLSISKIGSTQKDKILCSQEIITHVSQSCLNSSCLTPFPRSYKFHPPNVVVPPKGHMQHHWMKPEITPPGKENNLCPSKKYGFKKYVFYAYSYMNETVQGF